MKKRFKVIVIGSGPGGSLTSNLLSEKGLDVLMIEKGSYHKLSDHKAFSSDEMINKYKNGGLTLTFGNTKVNYVEGKCVGGGSEVNSGLYHRLPNEILDNWEKKNKLSFDRKFLEQSYIQNEKDLSISYLPGNTPKASQKLIDGCKSLNWKCIEVPRWFKYEDSFNKGVKQSMTETYIPQFLKNGGELLTETNVEKVTKKGKLNIVHVIKNGIKSSFECDYLFITGGAIDTPFLLRKSGYKGLVGKGLKTHPSFKLTALFKDKIYSDNEEVSVHQVKEFSPKISMGSSVSNKHYIGLSLNDTNSLNYLKDWEKMSSYYVMTSPEGEGSVRKLPFFNSPLVTFNLTKKDYYNIHKGIYLLSKLLFESGAVKLFPSGKQLSTIEKLEDVFKLNTVPKELLKLMTIHLFGSVQMAGDSKTGPINIDGHLWEDDTIYVNDSSILIDSPTVNPQGILMAMARMNVLNFLNKIKNEI